MVTLPGTDGGTTVADETSDAAEPFDPGAGSDDAAVADDGDCDASGVPVWATWADELVACDLDGDGSPEAVTLTGRVLKVYDSPGTADASEVEASNVSTTALEDGVSVCSTDAEWLVSDCHVGDIDHDGAPELALLVWARGNYGSSRPFWVEEDTDAYLEHVYLFKYVDGRLKPIFMSSGLEVEAVSMTLDDKGRVTLTARDGSETCWSWQSWGLKLVENLPAAGDDGTFTMFVAGDDIIHRRVLEAARTQDGGYDFSPIFAEVAAQARDADLAVVGQEAPLLATPDPGGLVYGAPYALGDALSDAGFDVVLNATNHVGDFGGGALQDELAWWRQAHPDVLALGVHQNASDQRYSLVTREGVTLALFNYTQSIGRDSKLSTDEAALVDMLADEDRLVSDLVSARDKADCSVVFLHTGPENKPLPDEQQRALCERLIDAGADAVVCAHTHVVMPFERVVTEAGNVGVVYYGLGNFVSSSPGADHVLESAATLTFEAGVAGEDAGEDVGSEDGDASVASASMTPLVCHVGLDGGEVKVLPLASYTDELAEQNMLLADEDEGQASVSALERRWVRTVVLGPGEL